MLADLKTLLALVPADASTGTYRSAVVDDNVLGKRSQSGRDRSFRYLRELYLLDKGQVLFRALRELWDLDPAGQPLIAMLSALARDSALRATSDAVLPLKVGEAVESKDLEASVQARFGNSYSPSVANKIGRNAASSWTQAGHLEGRSRKTRVRANHTPGATAFALLLGHLDGKRGTELFSTLWARTLDASPTELRRLAAAASARGWIEYKASGDVVEVGFRRLLPRTEH